MVLPDDLKTTIDEIGSLFRIETRTPIFSDYFISISPKLLSIENKDFDLFLQLQSSRNEALGIHDSQELEKYIIGIYPSIDEKGNLKTQVVDTSNPNYLFSILNLVHEPIDMNNLEACFNESEVIDWCRQNSLPYLSSYKIQKAITQDTVLYYDQVNLKDFYYHVAVMRCCIKLWNACVYEDVDAMKLYFDKLVHKSSNKILTTDLINQALALTISPQLDDLKIRFSGIGTKGMYVHSHTIFSSLYFQLASILFKSISSKGHLIQCKVCGRLTWGHGNKEYCNNPCNKRTEYNKKVASQRRKV